MELRIGEESRDAPRDGYSHEWCGWPAVKEDEEGLLRYSVDVLQYPGATPSICHVNLAKRLGLVSKERMLNVRLTGAFKWSEQQAAQYVVMVAVVSGYREEVFDDDFFV